MPAILDSCVSQVQRKVKPRKGQTRKEAAFGICTSSLKKAGMIKQKGERWILTAKGKRQKKA